jgi:hypothetical protein
MRLRPVLAFRRLLAMAALVALVVPASVLAASPNNWTASAYAEYGNAACGSHIPGAPLLAIVDFTRSGGHMTIRVRMDGTPATADTDYILSLWDAGDCSRIGGDIRPVTTNGFGVADETFTNIRTQGAKTFFATLWNTDLGFYNDTTIVP